MKFNLFVKKFCCLVVLLLAGVAFGARVRREVKIPDVPGYVTVKCDFHMHTVFSDGRVWPDVRVEEAWREGLDAFAIADHIEYHIHEEDVRIDHNRSYEIALPRAESLGLTIIRGAEISRDMPPGHLNAIFVKDSAALDTQEWRDAVKAGIEQGAFVFWNHPGWKKQAPEGKSVWYAEHTELYEKGWMHGIEVVNNDEYYPLVHKWCLEKKLTMVGNSDVHNPTNLNYEFHEGEHRAMTLVLAKDKSKEAIKEALKDRRTVVYWKNMLIGEEKYLRAIFNESIEIVNDEVTIKGEGAVHIQIRNRSEIDFELSANGAVEGISVPEDIRLYGDKSVLLRIRGSTEDFSGNKKIGIPYKVKNLLIGPDEGLGAELVIKVNFVPADKATGSPEG
ncbi:MAG: histidinol-phosphatase [Planctomycetota bacterium]|nr:MAG: histidinol-phosphatase [Planctomycetota bacterium]